MALYHGQVPGAVGGYFRAQFKIMGVVAVILLVGFFVLRIKYALLLGYPDFHSGFPPIFWNRNGPDPLGGFKGLKRQL